MRRRCSSPGSGPGGQVAPLPPYFAGRTNALHGSHAGEAVRHPALGPAGGVAQDPGSTASTPERAVSPGSRTTARTGSRRRMDPEHRAHVVEHGSGGGGLAAAGDAPVAPPEVRRLG